MPLQRGHDVANCGQLALRVLRIDECDSLIRRFADSLIADCWPVPMTFLVLSPAGARARDDGFGQADAAGIGVPVIRSLPSARTFFRRSSTGSIPSASASLSSGTRLRRCPGDRRSRGRRSPAGCWCRWRRYPQRRWGSHTRRCRSGCVAEDLVAGITVGAAVGDDLHLRATSTPSRRAPRRA